MKNFDISKSIKQDEGIQIWKNNDFHGTLNYVPRFGKTEIIRRVVSRTRSVEYNSNKTIILLTPTEITSRNLKFIADKYNCLLFTSTSFYNYIKTGNSKDIYLLIIDEIHKFINDKYSELFKTLEVQYKLGLTGSTLKVSDTNFLRNIGFPVVDIVTEEEAISKGWLAYYEEYNLAIPIREQDKLKYKYLNDNILNISSDINGIYKMVNQAFKKTVVDGDYGVMQACRTGLQLYADKSRTIPSQYVKPDEFRLVLATIMGYDKNKIPTNEYDKKKQTFWHPDNILELAKSYLKAVTARNNYLKHNVSKIDACIKILNFLQVPTIVYNESIETIDQIHNYFRNGEAVKYHSNLESAYMYESDGSIITYKTGEKAGQPKLFGKTTFKKLAIDSILNGLSKYLITGRSLNEGLNLPNIELIITTAGDTNPKTYEQRVARGKTVNPNDKSKKCIIINLFIDDFTMDFEYISSRDKQKLIIRQANVNNVIWLDNLDDLFALLKK